MVLHLLVEYNVATDSLGGIVNVEQLVHKANYLFLEDQVCVVEVVVFFFLVRHSFSNPFSLISLPLS